MLFAMKYIWYYFRDGSMQYDNQEGKWRRIRFYLCPRRQTQIPAPANKMYTKFEQFKLWSQRGVDF